MFQIPSDFRILPRPECVPVTLRLVKSRFNGRVTTRSASPYASDLLRCNSCHVTRTSGAQRCAQRYLRVLLVVVPGMRVVVTTEHHAIRLVFVAIAETTRHCGPHVSEG